MDSDGLDGRYGQGMDRTWTGHGRRFCFLNDGFVHRLVHILSMPCPCRPSSPWLACVHVG